MAFKTFIVLGMALTFVSCGRSNSTISGGNIVFGDSIAYGFGASDPRSNLANCLSESLGESFINRGINGRTSRDAISDLPLQLNPEIVVMSLGGNDLQQDMAVSLPSLFTRHSFPAEETIQNMRLIFRAFQEQGARVYYINMSPPLSVQHIKSIAAAIDGRLKKIKVMAKEFPNVTVVEDAMSGLWLNPERMYDDIHPNDLGYRQMCGRVVSAIKN